MTRASQVNKQERMAKAARLRYGEDMECPQIAEELGLQPQTVRNYFTEDQMEEFKRIFSDKEKYELQRMLEQQVYDLEQEAKAKIREGANHPEASAADKIRAGKEVMNLLGKKVSLFQELGIIQKPKERKEVEQKSTDVTISEGVVDPGNLSESVRERLEAENSE